MSSQEPHLRCPSQGQVPQALLHNKGWGWPGSHGHKFSGLASRGVHPCPCPAPARPHLSSSLSRSRAQNQALNCSSGSI